jgi:hypothetical protein
MKLSFLCYYNENLLDITKHSTFLVNPSKIYSNFFKYTPLVSKLVNSKLFLQFTAVNFQSILVVTTFIKKSLKVVKTLVELVKIGKNGKKVNFGYW